MSISSRWRELLAERIDEATTAISSIAGVRGLVLGGSTGRGEPWPLSDIDILPISAAGADTEAEIERRRAELVDWWAASARAQTLDIGRLRFTDAEVEHATSLNPTAAAQLMNDQRWFHGIDKAYGGRGIGDPDGLAQAFTTWATRIRFEPPVIAARVQYWKEQVHQARIQAMQALAQNDRVQATLKLRESARALRLAWLEGWGERLGSMGREWTRFERMAARHNALPLAQQLARLADAHPHNALERAKLAPAWLQERVERAYAARQEIGEEVSIEENARDQLAAFAVHVPKYRPQPWGEWINIPAPQLEQKLAELDDLIVDIE